MKREPNAGRNSPEWLFHRLNRAHHLASNTIFERFGIREYGQPMILFILQGYEKNGVSATQKELAEQLGVSQTTTAISLKSLERQGCVSKVTDKEDMRRNRVEITEKGIEIEEKFRKAFSDLDRAMYLGFTEEEKELISEIYVRMTKNLVYHANNGKTSCERNETD